MLLLIPKLVSCTTKYEILSLSKKMQQTTYSVVLSLQILPVKLNDVKEVVEIVDHRAAALAQLLEKTS